MTAKKVKYALADNGNGGLTQVAVSSDTGRVPSVPSISADEDRVAAAARAFTWLMDRTDGWFRGSPDKNGKVNHFKWKFNSTRWPNHYVYTRVDVGDWSTGIIELQRKVTMVDAGVLIPTFDTWYDTKD